MFAYDSANGVWNDMGDFDNIPDKTALALLRNRYAQGLEHSDGIVPVTSQNLQSLDPAISAEYAPKCHTDAQVMELNAMANCTKLFQVIKARMNAQ